jgi:multidrug efflux pump subunit AcrA (membrane-fusion protein)
LLLKQRTLVSTLNRKIIWIALIVGLFAAGGIYYAKGYSTNRTAVQASTVQTTVAQRGNLIISASGTGTLIANSDATFGFKTSGQVTKINVKIGDQVEVGQVLAQLDDTLAQMNYLEAQQALQELYSAASIATVEKEIATAQDTEYYAHEWLKYLLSPEVIEAEENLAIAQQKLAEAQADAKTNPSETANQTVKEKEQTVAFLTDKLTQAQTYYETYYLPETFGVYENVGSRRHPKQALATYIDPKTGEELPEIDAPSADDIATARNNLAQARETIEEDKEYLEILRSGSIPEGATGPKLTTLYEAQLAVDNAKTALDKTQLMAPISGTVTTLSLSIGQQVDTSSVITISQLSQPYLLDAYVDESDWSTAQTGNKATVTFDLLPKKTFPGTVTLVYPELDPSFEASLVHLRVQLDQSFSQDLPAGTGVSLNILGDEARNVVMIPVGALHESNGVHYVNVIQNGQKVRRTIEIGLKSDTYVEVKSGLEAGASVVTK